jgi:hypothetical protein
MVNAVLSSRREALVRPRPAPAPLLDGIRRADWTERPAAARRLGAILADRGEVAYCVGGVGEAPLRDRAEARGSMRMRSAKLLTAAFRYVCDCQICDRSLDRLKLLLAFNVRLQSRFAAHIDETSDARFVTTGWRRGLPIGV